MLYARETHVNSSEGYQVGETDIYETFAETPGELFRSCRKEYGRCISRVYIDGPNNGRPIPVGWVFQKRQQYEDCDKTYLMETWVTLFAKPDTVTRQHHYVTVAGKAL